MSPVLIEHSGFIYGSWALSRQQDSLKRLPKDIDLGFNANMTRVREVIGAITTLFGDDLWGCERVRFSDDVRSPVVFRLGITASSEGVEGDVLLGLAFVRAHDPGRLVRVDVGVGPPLQLLSWEACLAQKYVRLSLRRSGDRRHTRWQDLMDMWDVGVNLDPTGVTAWRDAIRDEARRRRLPYVLRLPAPPAEWADSWQAKCFEDRAPRPDPHIVVAAINDWLEG
jgi:hypothetical protein